MINTRVTLHSSYLIEANRLSWLIISVQPKQQSFNIVIKYVFKVRNGVAADVTNYTVPLLLDTQHTSNG